MLSVSNILRAAGVSPSFDGIPPAILETARQRGEAVHRAIELMEQGDLDESSLDERIMPYVMAHKAFVRDSGYRVVATEEMVTHPTLGYRGRLDSRGWLHRVRTVLDQKATATIHPAVGVQSAAYALALEEPHRALAAVHLRRDGTYRLLHYDYEEHVRVFQAALIVAKYGTAPSLFDVPPDVIRAQEAIGQWKQRNGLT